MRKKRAFKNRISLVFMMMTFAILITFYIAMIVFAQHGAFTINLESQMIPDLTSEFAVQPGSGNFAAVVDETALKEGVLTSTISKVSADILFQIILWGTVIVVLLSVIAFFVTRFLSNRLISPLITQTNQIINLSDGPIYNELLPLQTEYTALYEKEQKMIREKSQFAAYSSHELRNFLTLLSAKSEILGENNAEAAIKEIHQDIANFKPVLNELLDYAHLSDKEIVLEKVDIAEIVARVCDQYAATSQTISFHFEESKNYTTVGKNVLLERAIINLVNNGLRHSENDQVTINLYTTGQGMINLDIINIGETIEPEMLEQIWQPFFTKSDDGVGLGLSFVKRALEQCKAVITVSSIEGKTIFHIEFNAAKET